jgi:hypothetical protein
MEPCWLSPSRSSLMAAAHKCQSSDGRKTARWRDWGRAGHFQMGLRTQLCPFQVRLSFYAAQKARLPESFRRKVHAYDCNLKISVSPTSSKQSARARYFARGSAIFQIKPIGGQPRSRNQSTGAPFLNKDGSVLSYLGSTASSCACPWARWWKRTCAVLPTILNAGLISCLSANTLCLIFLCIVSSVWIKLMPLRCLTQVIYAMGSKIGMFTSLCTRK